MRLTGRTVTPDAEASEGGQEQLSIITCSERPSSEGVLDAVAVKRRQLLSSSERAARRSDKTSQQQGLAMGFRERRPWTRSAPDVLDEARTSTGRSRTKDSSSNARLPQMRRLVNQCRRVCAERCPLTMRHVATRSGHSCGSESTRTRPHGSVTTPSFGGLHTETRRQELEAIAQRSYGPASLILWVYRGPRAIWRRDSSRPRRLPQLSNARSTLSPV